ncbi:MAG: MATE family efflux transporter [Lautropia sp.]
MAASRDTADLRGMSAAEAVLAAARLPGARPGPGGRLQVDLGRVLALALPLFLNAGIQSILNLTDTWFVGRISTSAIAAVAAVHWIVVGMILLLGGVGLAVQTFAAQAHGAGRRRRASSYAWNGVWASLVLMPAFLAIAWGGTRLLPALALDADVTRLAIDYWAPRMGGGVLAVLLWSTQSFFNGVSRVRTTLAINVVVALANAVFDEVLMFRLGLGMAGAAWATNLAQALGVAIGVWLLWGSPAVRDQFAAHLTWRPRPRLIRRMIVMGIGIGAMIAFDLLGLAVFQILMTRVSVLDGAATQVVMMLTSIAYMPAVGLGMAGTTLVGQSIGAGSPAWARHVGNRVIALAAAYMGTVGVLIALAGPLILPWFAIGESGAASPGADAGGDATLVALGSTLLWVAACYQFFDGLQLGAGFCLRGAGDTRFPALALLLLSWLVFLPLVHVLTFDGGAGPIAALPGIGAGSVGGWSAAVVYVTLLAVVLVSRWRSDRWTRIRVG